MDILSQFKKSIDNFPKNPSDLNMICSITYGEYLASVKILQALTFPMGLVRKELEALITALDGAVYKEIIDALNKLDKALKSILPTPFNKNMKLDINTAKFGSLLSNACEDFLASIPESLFNTFRDVQNGLINASNLFNDMMALPSDLAGTISASLLSFKDQALKDILGALFDTILAPLIAYEEFIRDNGIFDMIVKMKRTESCMTKPGICNRPRQDFIHKGSKKLYSVYYQEQFLMDAKGNINLKSLCNTSQEISKINNILKNMNSFRITVR